MPAIARSHANEGFTRLMRVKKNMHQSIRETFCSCHLFVPNGYIQIKMNRYLRIYQIVYLELTPQTSKIETLLTKMF